ncbi:hypothetical protein E3T54_05490 [Cryobacterium sp. Sr8]|uniref:hypothetical protein n=1 Tax=Cryobacterium sp. Sr8 TaxID=1259203 RepID=UPI00106BB922|nr:hypothetical protein [Cryobacterium sp. Sr8]TFD79131.1 hypothetical protein E3T54_05490 [Cryobacterium sp. Sr8]
MERSHHAQAWPKKADADEGAKPGATEQESAELRDAKKRIRLLEQEAEVMRRVTVACGCWASARKRSTNGTTPT